MESRTGPERAGSLVIELAARTVLVDGKRVELPPTEFSLLAVLAARPGELVTHKELLEEAFGDSAYMDAQDLHWRIWSIRKLIGDTEKKLIRNRRGQGFVLEARGVEIIDGVADLPEAPSDEEPIVIRLEEPVPTEAIEDPAEPLPGPHRFVVSPFALLLVVLFAGLALGGSWLAGFTLSQRGAPSANVQRPSPQAKSDQASDDLQGGKGARESRGSRSTRGNSSKGRADNGNVTAGATTDTIGTGDITSGNAASDSTSSNESSGSGSDKQQKPPPPPPPQPNAQLYHLHNPETGDHIMTTSSATANQKQAEGYDASVQGGVFTSQEKGTVAITLDGGSAYVYSNASSAPDGVSVAALYRLSSDNDFFYTTSSSAANQAQAQGWSRSTAGYVTT